MYDRSSRLLGAEVSKPKSTGATLRRLWRYLRHYGIVLVLVIVAVVASTYMQVLIPRLMGEAVDCFLGPFAARQTAENVPQALPTVNLPEELSSAQSTAYSNCTFVDAGTLTTSEEAIRGLGLLVLLILGLYVGSTVLSGLMFYLMSWAGFHVLRDLRAQIFRHLQRLSLGYFTRHEAGDVMSRLTNDMDTIQQVIGFGLISVFQGGLLIAWIVVTMFSVNAPYAVVSLIPLPVMFLATRWFSSQARKAFRRARVEIGAVNADLQENFAAVREVQAFGREEENIEQFRVSNAANRDANIQAQAYTSALAPTLEALSYVSLALVAVVGGIAILSGQSFAGTSISVGLIITFIGYTQQFNRPVQQIATFWTNIQSAIAGAERIFGLLDEQPNLVDKPDAQRLPEVVGHVRYQNVYAEYNPGESVLKGVDIEARPGQTVAIVGPTGAGKTTIINLLPRFWDVSEGRVTVDDHDVRDVTRESLRSQIGIVLQDTFLFSDTILDNIRYGRPEATEDEVIAAAKIARAHDFIVRLEDGYETQLGERGVGLSQGQRQLVAIARVALSDPRILILDEATSSVDTRTEREIQKALERLLVGRTSFVIAHRLSTIRKADLLLVLDHGQIVERGTHGELLKAEGFYYDLYMSQFRRETDGEGTEAQDSLAEDAFFVPGD